MMSKSRVDAQHLLKLGLVLILLCANLNCGHKLISEDNSDIILCRDCGADLAEAIYLDNHLSPAALIKGNQSLFLRLNVQVQVLENPLKNKFQVITLAKASCIGVEHWHTEHSWFPGFAWKFCLCGECGQHLGWIFEPVSTAVASRKSPSDEGFYALVLDNVLSESFSDSLLIVPRSYAG